MPPDPGPDQLRAWARGRALNHLAILGACLGLAVGPLLSSLLALVGVSTAGDATIGAVGIVVPWVLLTTIVAVFQVCPRCRKFWNVRGLFGFHTPYSPSCLNCRMPSPPLGPAEPRWRAMAAALLIAPVLASAAVFAAAHLAAASP